MPSFVLSEQSTFQLIDEAILLEFIYNDSASPTRLNTSQVGFSQFFNAYTGSLYVFNRGIDETLVNLDRTAIPVSSSTFVYLDQNDPIPYQLFDAENLSRTDHTFSPDFDVTYNTVRFHLAQGYDLQDLAGLIFFASVREKTGKFVTLASILYRTGFDDMLTFTPRPFMFGVSIFDKYIEFKIPDIWIAQADFDDVIFQSNSLPFKLSTNNTGWERDGMLNVGVRYIEEAYRENSFLFLEVEETKATSFPRFRPYAELRALLRESEEGDFFEFGLLNGEDTIEDLIFALNAQPDGNFVVEHRIVVSEQISSSFETTAEFQVVQTDAFDSLQTFRPIIKFSNLAVAYRIEYEGLLKNLVNQRSITRRATLISTDVHKYGKTLARIEVPGGLQSYSVYNARPSKMMIDVTTPRASQSAVMTPVFIERMTLALQVADTEVGNGTQFDNVYFPQGKALIFISPFDNVFRFRIVRDGVPLNLVVSQEEKYILTFGGNLAFEESTEVQTDKSRGELLYRINSTNSQKIRQSLTSNNFQFFITKRNAANGEETYIYTGRFTDTETGERNAEGIILETQAVDTNSANVQTMNLTESLIDDSLQVNLRKAVLPPEDQVV